MIARNASIESYAMIVCEELQVLRSRKNPRHVASSAPTMIVNNLESLSGELELRPSIVLTIHPIVSLYTTCGYRAFDELSSRML